MKNIVLSTILVLASLSTACGVAGTTNHPTAQPVAQTSKDPHAADHKARTVLTAFGDPHKLPGQTCVWRIEGYPEEGDFATSEEAGAYMLHNVVSYDTTGRDTSVNIHIETDTKLTVQEVCPNTTNTPAPGVLAFSNLNN